MTLSGFPSAAPPPSAPSMPPFAAGPAPGVSALPSGLASALSEAAITALRRFIERLPAADASGDPPYELFRQVDGRVAGRVGRWELTSRFAPVVTAEGALQAVSASIEVAALPVTRPTDAALHGNVAQVHAAAPGEVAQAGGAPSGGLPLVEQLFAEATTDEELVALDRRARFIHLLNCFMQTAHAPAPINVHLSIHPRLLSAVTTDHGRAFRRVIDSLGVPLAHVVMVLPCMPAGTEDLQANVLASYRLNGFAAHFSAGSTEQAHRLVSRIAPDALQIPVAHLAAGLEANPQVPLLATQVDSAALHELAVAAGAVLLQGEAIGVAKAAVPQTVTAPLFVAGPP